MVTRGKRASSGGRDAIVLHAADGLVKSQLAKIFERILRLDERTRRHVEPVDQPGQQKTQRSTARKQRQPFALRGAERSCPRIALQQSASLGDVVGMVRLEAPGVEADG